MCLISRLMARKPICFTRACESPVNIESISRKPYDYQRDKANNTYFDKYVAAANYAVGVYMAGAGYGKWQSVTIAQTWGFFTSSTKYDETAREWTEKGWDDAHRGDWKTK